ncbi:hypothetical protein [Candidatus Villigracilis saccharophilus]|uniref:hypothetical protein n=1 Tax=Candidatus Villigracilis saccharophilus TaxID=3140684 RepID=UPI0031354F49|nr:hypothetical protein [Anaerolineales bacterium]
MRKLIVVASGILFLSLSLAWWMNSHQPKPIELIPVLTGQPEYCITCHADLPEISASHPVETFGCVSCHGGERLALNADLAHSTMRGGANPSDLSVAEISCGGSSCHSGSEADDRDHIQRVMTSVQSTYAGAIANIRFTFGAQADLSAHFGINAITDEQTQTGIASLASFEATADANPMILKFGENCLTCHINALAREGDSFARQNGCAACHSNGQHKLTTAISYTQCNTCHNRGNYDLRTMTFIQRTDRPAKRVDDYYQPIAQFTQCEYTLDCIDCHTRSEVMGDGDIHANKKDIQYVQCKTCHGTPTELPLTKTIEDPNDIAFKMGFLNPVVDLKPGDKILVTEKGEPLWNTRVLSDGTYEMIGKATKQKFNFRPVMGSSCTQTGEDQSSTYCHECHAVER